MGWPNNEDAIRVKASSAGILPNTGADLAPAINALAATMGVGGSPDGGVLLLDVNDGIYEINSPINLPSKVAIQGTGRRSTILKAKSTFSGAYMVRTGPTSTGFGFDTYVKSMNLDCNSVTDITGVKNERGQEGSGVFDVLISNYMRNGIDASGSGVANISFADLELYASASATGTVYGVNINGAGGANKIDRITARCSAAVSTVMTAGLYAQDCSLSGQALHFEYGVNGILVGGNNTCCRIDGVTSGSTASNITNLINLNGGAVRSRFTNIVKYGATNSFVNSLISLTSTDSFIPDTLALTNIAYSSVNAITVTGSPFTYRNTSLYNRNVLVQGGTVSLIEYSVDNTTFYTVGILTDNMYFVPVGSRLRVTYTVAPTMQGVNVV